VSAPTHFINPNQIPSSIRISIEERVAQLIVRKRRARDMHSSRAFESKGPKKRRRCLKCSEPMRSEEVSAGAHLCSGCNAENSRYGMAATKAPPPMHIAQKYISIEEKEHL
jgi:hypothetical protein